MHTKNETITVAWCDGGTVDGKFADNLINTLLLAKDNNIPIVNKIRAVGNQIGRQRQDVFDEWADNSKTDWLLWIDSDIVMTFDVLKTLWGAADKLSVPIISGIYFISREGEQSLMQPLPSIFDLGENESELSHIINIPENKVIPVGAAGFGCLLMHKSIIDPLRNINPGYSIFAEKEYVGEKFISEDIAFFHNLNKAGIKAYAHTSAFVQHMKRFSFDLNYFNLYWNSKEKNV